MSEDNDPNHINETNKREEPALATEEDTTEPSNDNSGQVVRLTPQPAKESVVAQTQQYQAKVCSLPFGEESILTGHRVARAAHSVKFAIAST